MPDVDNQLVNFLSDKSANPKKYPQIVEFLRKKDYKFVRELGQGACGITVLLHDEVIDEKFVCKKYSPQFEGENNKLFELFIDEIKILHKVAHPNVVRVFNYYIYKENLTGYILMEHVEGEEIDGYVRRKPEAINQLFVQAIEAFSYLESIGILHRDIRLANLMATQEGSLKIIDFGFGKQIVSGGGFGKSISLNWLFDPPEEFENSIYDFSSEVYFVGRLFNMLIEDNKIQNFSYRSALERMTSRKRDERSSYFSEIYKIVQEKGFTEITFSRDEINTYRSFSTGLSSVFRRIREDTRYISDTDAIVNNLRELYQSVMLESHVPDPTNLSNIFVRGQYYFNKDAEIEVQYLLDFIKLLESYPKEKQNIVISNLHSRLDAVQRYDVPQDDEIPF